MKGGVSIELVYCVPKMKLKEELLNIHTFYNNPEKFHIHKIEENTISTEEPSLSDAMFKVYELAELFVANKLLKIELDSVDFHYIAEGVSTLETIMEATTFFYGYDQEDKKSVKLKMHGYCNLLPKGEGIYLLKNPLLPNSEGVTSYPVIESQVYYPMDSNCFYTHYVSRTGAEGNQYLFLNPETGVSSTTK